MRTRMWVLRLRVPLAVALLALSMPAWALSPTEMAKLLADDGDSRDQLGQAVAIDGDTAIVGAHLDDDRGTSAGAAYVFVRDGAGDWSQQAKLTASDGASSNLFGVSVALDGDTAIIGARGWLMDSGAAYVFTRTGGNWSEQSRLHAGDQDVFALFGASVALDGDIAVIGAPGAAIDSNNSVGAAYVFTGAGGSWNQLAKLTAGDGAAGDGFGTSVAVAGDIAAIGAPLADSGTAGSAGAAYVFTRAGGVWSERDKLAAGDGASLDEFGRRIAADGDTVVVASPFADTSGADAGAAYVFVRDAMDAWTQQARLTAGDGMGGDLFGNAVALDGDTAVIGAPGNSVFSVGAAFAFTRAGDAWSEPATLTGSDSMPGDRFGWSVAVDGDTAAIGAVEADGATDRTGAAYVFRLADGDADGDGVVDGDDQCGQTQPGAIVDPTGCSIAQLCPSSGPPGTSEPWRNHGKYVSCTVDAARGFVGLGLITESEMGAIVSNVARSKGEAKREGRAKRK